MVIDELKKFEAEEPEIIFEWHDRETGAEGWVVINSLRGGAAGGGTRMRKGLNKHEVVSLAKTMEIKFTVSGPQIGGAKSGINFDPADPRKNDVLQRWYKAIRPLLKNYYGTGGDLNVDEIHEVIPVTASLNILHPQEGVINGHFDGLSGEDKRKMIGNLRSIVSKVIVDQRYSPDVQKKYTVADMVTGWGVSESVRIYLEKTGQTNEGKKVIVQGWGNVASAAAYYQSLLGAKIVGIIDREGGLINEKGFDHQDIRKLFLEKKGNRLHSNELLTFEEINRKIWDVEADIFLPCAASRIVSLEHLERLKKGRVKMIASGANVPFNDPEIFYGPTMQWADRNFTLIPDFIANCGMARTFAFCMQPIEDFDDEAIFTDVSKTIEKAIDEVLTLNNKETLFSQTAFQIALQKLKNNQHELVR